MIKAYKYLKLLIMKNLANLGNALNKAEQKTINGGAPTYCSDTVPCKSGYFCNGCHCVIAILD